MLVQITELKGPALDWAVTKATGEIDKHDAEPKHFLYWQSSGSNRYTTHWSDAGPLIEELGISIVEHGKGWGATHEVNFLQTDEDGTLCTCFYEVDLYLGPTQLIAACRCYVAVKLQAYQIDIPEDLC